MNINKISYTTFVAFTTAILTLLTTSVLVGQSRATEAERADDEPKLITLEELAEHDSLDSCWKAIDGKVYDVTDYIPDHPTPAAVMLEWCGRDATEGWYNKSPGRPHSPVAARLLQAYLIGELEGVEAEAEPAATETDEVADRPERPSGKVLLGLAPGTYLDGRYRGTFADRGYIQVNIQFDLRDNHLHDISFRHLYYAGVDYLGLEADEELYAVMQQHEQILEHLEGKPVTAIVDLYTPENVADDIDGFTGATVRGSKITSAIRDALNRGVYQWR